MPTDRRTFLGSIAAAAVAPTVLAAGRARQPARERPVTDRAPNKEETGPRVRMSLKYGMIGEGDTVEAKFDLAMNAGFVGVELDSPSDLDLDEVLRAKEKTGIEIPGVVDSVHWNKTLSHPDPEVRAEGRHGLETAIFDCKKIGGTSVLLVPAVVNGDVSYKDAWDRSLREIQRVVPIAKENGVQIALENVWNNFLLSPLETRDYIMRCNRRGADARFEPGMTVGMHLDIGNLWNFAWPQHWVEALGPAILKLDVKGYSRAISDKEGKWAGFRPPIGDGDVPWAATCEALKKVSYRGWAAAEVGGGGLDHLTDVCQRMHRVFEPLNA